MAEFKIKYSIRVKTETTYGPELDMVYRHGDDAKTVGIELKSELWSEGCRGIKILEVTEVVKPVVVPEPKLADVVTTAFYPNAGAQPWDNIEVHPVREFISGDGTRCCEVIDNLENDTPDFYSVYVHMVEGGVMCLADVPTEQDANDLALMIKNMLPNYVDNGYLK